MKIEYQVVVCCSSLHDPNTWYFFRPNGLEVKVVLKDNWFKASAKLTDLEINYLDTYLR